MRRMRRTGARGRRVLAGGERRAGDEWPAGMCPKCGAGVFIEKHADRAETVRALAAVVQTQVDNIELLANALEAVDMYDSTRSHVSHIVSLRETESKLRAAYTDALRDIGDVADVGEAKDAWRQYAAALTVRDVRRRAIARGLNPSPPAFVVDPK